MRILITGASGFLGKRLVREYSGSYEVFAATHKNMELTDVDQVRSVFAEIRPEAVIHCGAVSDVNTCRERPEWSEQINVTGTKNVAAACREYQAKMIFCSSDQIYIRQWKAEEDEEFWKPHVETESLSPVPIYGQQKLQAEKLCLQEQPDSVILRLTLMYDVPDDLEREHNKGMFAEGLKNHIQTNTVQTFYQNNCRGITNCQEIVKNMEKAMRLDPGIYNYGSTNDRNLYDTMRSLFQQFGKAELIQPGQGDCRNLTMNTQKIKDCGIFFESTEDGLKRYLSR